MLLYCYLVTKLCPNSLQSLWTEAWHAPLSMGFSRKNIGVGHHFFLQGIVPSQGSNPRLLHCRWILYHWATLSLKLSFYFFWVIHRKEITWYPSTYIILSSLSNVLGPHKILLKTNEERVFSPVIRTFTFSIPNKYFNCLFVWCCGVAPSALWQQEVNLSLIKWERGIGKGKLVHLSLAHSLWGHFFTRVFKLKI